MPRLAGYLGTEPGELDAAASACLEEINKLEHIIDQLNLRSNSVLAVWTGTAASSLDEAVSDQIGRIEAAQSTLRTAVVALKDCADEIRDAIKRAREEMEKERERQGQG